MEQSVRGAEGEAQGGKDEAEAQEEREWADYPATPHWKRFQLLGDSEWIEALQWAEADEIAGENESLRNVNEYLVNEGTLIHRVLKDYSLYPHPTRSRAQDSLYDAISDQLQLLDVSCGIDASEVRQRCLQWLVNHADAPLGSLPSAREAVARAAGVSFERFLELQRREDAWPHFLMAQVAAQCFELAIYIVSFNFRYGLRCFRLVPVEGRLSEWSPASFAPHRLWCDVDERTVLLCHFRTAHYRSILFVDEVERLYEAQVAQLGKDGIDHYNWCALLRRLGRYEDSIYHCQRELLEHPKSQIAHSVWGGVLGDKHQYELAIEQHRKQLELCPDHVQSHNGLGCNLHFLQRYEEAIAEYELQMRYNPYNMHSARNWGLALELLDRQKEALPLFEKQLQRYPDFRVAHRSWALLLRDLGKLDVALQYYERKLEEQPYNAGLLRYLIANVYESSPGSAKNAVQLPDYDLAYKYYRAQVRVNPWDDRSCAGLARVMEHRERQQEALALLQRMVQINPKHTVAYENLGRCLAKLGRSEEAIAAFRQQMKYNTQDKHSYLNFISDTLLEMGKYEEAIKVAEESLALKPDNLIALGCIGSALTSMKRNEEALVVYRKQLQLDKRRVSYVHYNIALCYLQLADYPKALQWFHQHLKYHEDDALTLLQVAHTHFYQRNTTIAVEYYKRCLAVDQEGTDKLGVCYFIGETYQLDGNYAKAITWYERHVKNHPNDRRVHLNWARALRGYLRLTGSPIEGEVKNEIIYHMQRSFGIEHRYCQPMAGINTPRDALKEIFRYRAFFLVSELSRTHPTRPWEPQLHRRFSWTFRREAWQVLLLVTRFKNRHDSAYFPRQLVYLILQHLSRVSSDDFADIAQTYRYEYGSRALSEVPSHDLHHWMQCTLCQVNPAHGASVGSLATEHAQQQLACVVAACAELQNRVERGALALGSVPNLYNSLGVARCLQKKYRAGHDAFRAQLEADATHRVARYNQIFALALTSGALPSDVEGEEVDWEEAGLLGNLGEVEDEEEAADEEKRKRADADGAEHEGTEAKHARRRSRGYSRDALRKKLAALAKQQLAVAPPVVHWCHLLVGLLLERLGMLSLACEHFEKQHELKPWGDPYVMYYWARLLLRRAKVGQEDEKEAALRARQMLEEQLELNPTRGHLLLARVIALHLKESEEVEVKDKEGVEKAQLRMSAAAKHHFKEQLLVDPRKVHKWWGRVYLELGRGSAALAHFRLQKLIRQLPSNDVMELWITQAHDAEGEGDGFFD